MDRRTLVRVASVIGALGCVAWATWLVFNFADYGSDSTCGSVFRYHGAGEPCASIMRGRIVGVIALVAAAAFLAAWSLRSPPEST